MDKLLINASPVSDVYGRILSMILGGELKSGVRIVEDELCDKLQVGRTPLREALLVLQGAGYVQRRRGWVVSQVDNTQIGAIFESRAAIEGATARLAANRVTDEILQQLFHLIDQMEQIAAPERRELNRLNTLFHQLIVDTASNPLLADFHKRTHFYYWLLQVPIIFTAEETRAVNDQHRLILDCLQNRDGRAAEEAARQHIESTWHIIEPALRQ